MFYIIITPIITVTLTKMMYAGENTMVVEDALSRINSIIERKPLEQTADKKHPADTSITFENVSFRYPGAANDALHDVSLKINAGEQVAFVGPSGGGKTTLARLIARFADVTEGNILIGGVNVKNIDEKELMDTVSFVFQDSHLLKMSILDNVRMGNKNATRQEVMEALKNAQCDDIIEKLPDGIDTVIGSKGTYLSGGEAQRIAIARAILKDAPILLLDESTASLDADNEAKINQALDRLMKGKTVFVIAHRLNTIQNADQIIVLNQGRIEETGTHEELLRKKGHYYEMVQEQQKAREWIVKGA